MRCNLRKTDSFKLVACSNDKWLKRQENADKKCNVVTKRSSILGEHQTRHKQYAKSRGLLRRRLRRKWHNCGLGIRSSTTNWCSETNISRFDNRCDNNRNCGKHFGALRQLHEVCQLNVWQNLKWTMKRKLLLDDIENLIITWSTWYWKVWCFFVFHKTWWIISFFGLT